MTTLEGIRAIPVQDFRATAEDGTQIDFRLTYRPAAQFFSLDVKTESFQVYNVMVRNSPNILEPWAKVLPFGLDVTVKDGGEPFLINDFSTGRVSFGILTHAEVEQVISDYSFIRDNT